jgi:regulatory protein
MNDKKNKESSNLSSPTGGQGAALQKLKHYCIYQERSHYEVKQKLYELKVRSSDHDEIIASLIDEDYLNEERFAIQFAGGKFRMKQWGKKKILYALRGKKVSDYSIKKALAEINEDDYLIVLKKLAEGKYNLLKEEQILERKKKTIDYLIQKGYEYDNVNKILSSLTEK